MDEAYLIAQRAYLLAIECEMQQMIACNAERSRKDLTIAYPEEAFEKLRQEARGIGDYLMQNR